jgi:hypothetical protein
MKFKGLHFADVAEIQEAVTDELNNDQKYMPMEIILKKKSYVPTSCHRFKKNQP